MKDPRSTCRAWLAPLVTTFLVGCIYPIEFVDWANAVGDVRTLCGEAAPADTRVTEPVQSVLTTPQIPLDITQLATRQYRSGEWALDEYTWQTGIARIWFGPADFLRATDPTHENYSNGPPVDCSTRINQVDLETITNSIDADTITYSNHASTFGEFSVRQFDTTDGTQRCISVNTGAITGQDSTDPQILRIKVLDCRNPKAAQAGHLALIEAITKARFADRE